MLERNTEIKTYALIRLEGTNCKIPQKAGKNVAKLVCRILCELKRTDSLHGSSSQGSRTLDDHFTFLFFEYHIVLCFF